MNVYFISGLGADERAFQKITLPEGFNAIHLPWIATQKNESLLDYGLRLSQKIDKKKPFVLIGLSLGGMLVSELTDLLKPEKSILISSVSNRHELPWYFRFCGKIQLYRVLPYRWLKHTNFIAFYLFGVKTQEEKNLLRQIFQDTDLTFLSWAIKSISTWKKESRPENLIQIHGEKDRIFPLRNVHATDVVKKGGHFMVFSLPEEMNEILKKVLLS